MRVIYQLILEITTNILCSIKHRAKDVCFLICLCISFLCSQCTSDHAADSTVLMNDHVVAKVYGESLFRSDLPDLQEEKLNRKDSIAFVNKFIDDWVHQQVIAHYCTQKESGNSAIEKQVTAYRNTLLIHQFKSDFWEQEVDTNVSENELLAELKLKPEQNRLNTTIVRGRFIVLARNAPKIDQIRTLIAKQGGNEKKELKSICLRFAEQFQIQDEHWQDLDFLVSKSPFATNLGKYERKGNYEIADEDYLYLLSIVDIKPFGTIAPLSYIKDKLKVSILQDRKVRNWALFEQKCYKEALGKHEIEIKNEK
ncbi:MAG: hypothetical protein RL060_1412 [Bacteroidota bacterium]